MCKAFTQEKQSSPGKKKAENEKIKQSGKKDAHDFETMSQQQNRYGKGRERSGSDGEDQVRGSNSLTLKKRNMKKHQEQERSNQQQQENRQEQSRRSTSEELSGMNEKQNASSNRGGTTDIDEDALTVDRGNKSERGSNITTKKSVTGSDYDGQVA